MDSDEDELEARVAALEREVAELRELVEGLEGRPEEGSETGERSRPGSPAGGGEAQGATREDVVEDRAAGPSEGATGTVGDRPAAASGNVDSPAAQRPADAGEATGSGTGTDGREPEDVVAAGVDRARKLSVTTLLGVAGVLALVVMLGFATQYAIQEELIGRFGQVLAGTGAGLVLWVGGVATARRTALERWGWIVAGGGVAVTYYAVYASYAFEAYREAIQPPLLAVFLVLAAIATLAVVTSVLEDQWVLAGESLLLGFVTVWFARDIALPGLGYAFLLTLGIGVVVRYRNWVRLTVPAVLGSYGAGIAVLGETPETDVAGGIFVAYCIAVFVTYLVTTLYATDYQISTEVTTATNVAGFGLLGFAGFTGFFGEAWEPAAPLLASLGLGLAVVALESDREGPIPNLEPASWNGFKLAPGLFVLTTVVGVGLQSAFWAGVVAAAVVPVATALAADRNAWVYGWTVPLGLALWLLLVPIQAFVYGGIDRGALAEPAVTYTLVATAIAVALAWRVAEHEGLSIADRIPVWKGYAWLFAGVAFVTPAVDLSGVVLSSAWTLLGIGLLAAGIGLGRVELRRSSFVVFGLTYLKVFFFDTTELALPQRIVSLLVLGVVLLVASWVYARYLGDLAVDGDADEE